MPCRTLTLAVLWLAAASLGCGGDTEASLAESNAGSRVVDEEQNTKLVRIGLLADVHHDPAIATRGEFITEAIDQLDSWNPKLVAVLGDLMERDVGPVLPYDDSCAATILADLATRVRIGGARRTMVTGNHDFVRTTPGAVLAALPGDVTESFLPGKFYGSFDHQGIHVILLDPNYKINVEPAEHWAPDYSYWSAERSAGYSFGGYIPQEELDWLTEDLAATSLPTIVLHHQALGTMSYSPISRIANADAVMAILSKSRKVVAAVSGHIHAAKYAKVDGVNYFSINATRYRAHAQMTIDVKSRIVRVGNWQNDPIGGYREVSAVSATY